jgi:hypothetical protein
MAFDYTRSMFARPLCKTGITLRALTLMLAVGVWADWVCAQTDGTRADGPPRKRLWRPIARLDEALVREASGVVASRKYPGVLWAHGDSGNAPKLAAFDTNGVRICEVIVSAAPNIDWEDICADDAGHLFIGDIGNNTGLLPVRYIYQIDEPDPHHPPQHPITPTRSWRVRYGASQRVNCESLFMHRNRFHTVVRRPAGRSTVYRLEPNDAGDLVFEPADTVPWPSVTGADVSRDGGTLLICSPRSAALFRLTGDGEFVASDPRRAITFPNRGTIEACCLSEAGIFLIAENGNLFRTTEQDFDAQVRFRLK